eukprot:10101069-Karenia_brevis.AAC.1
MATQAFVTSAVADETTARTQFQTDTNTVLATKQTITTVNDTIVVGDITFGGQGFSMQAIMNNKQQVDGPQTR